MKKVSIFFMGIVGVSLQLNAQPLQINVMTIISPFFAPYSQNSSSNSNPVNSGVQFTVPNYAPLPSARRTGYAASNTYSYFLYPNPVVDQLNVSWDPLIEMKKIRVVNYEGVEMMDVIVSSDRTEVLHAGDLKPGVYFIYLDSEEGTEVARFIKD